MNVYKIDDGEQWWVAAETKEQALRIYLKPLVIEGTDLSDLSKVKIDDPCPLEEIEVEELQPDTLIPVTQDDGVTVLTKTAAEWAIDGEGMIAASVF